MDDAARVTGYSKGTFRRWIKSSKLPAIKDQKPHLILGGDLLDFLKGRAARGAKLQLHECYCLKCREPRAPALGMADYIPMTATTGNLRGICPECGSLMHKAVSRAALPSLNGILDVTPVEAGERLVDTPDPSPDDHFLKEPKADA